MIDMIETVYRGAKKGRGLVSMRSDPDPRNLRFRRQVHINLALFTGCQPQGLQHKVQVLRDNTSQLQLMSSPCL